MRLVIFDGLIHSIILVIFWNFLFTTSEMIGDYSYKHAKYELPGELRNNLRLRILGNWEISRKRINSIEWYPSADSPCQNESFVNTSKKLLINRN